MHDEQHEQRTGRDGRSASEPAGELREDESSRAFGAAMNRLTAMAERRWRRGRPPRRGRKAALRQLRRVGLRQRPDRPHVRRAPRARRPHARRVRRACTRAGDGGEDSEPGDGEPHPPRRGAAWTSLDSVVVGLQFRACEPRRVGRVAWRSGCPSCGAPDALGLGVGFGGLSIAARCGCARTAILAALGIEEVER